MTAQLHLTIDAFTLELLLERSQRLVDIVVANDDLHKVSSLSNSVARVQQRRTLWAETANVWVRSESFPQR
jgi:hypothetical protein